MNKEDLNMILGGSNMKDCVKPGKNSIFFKNGKMVICRNSVGGKSVNFLDLE